MWKLLLWWESLCVLDPLRSRRRECGHQTCHQGFCRATQQYCMIIVVALANHVLLTCTLLHSSRPSSPILFIPAKPWSSTIWHTFSSGCTTVREDWMSGWCCKKIQLGLFCWIAYVCLRYLLFSSPVFPFVSKTSIS